MIWEQLADAIERELASHPQDYLIQTTISKTMHPYMRPLSTAYWDELQKSDYFKKEILPAAEDGPVGCPAKFDDHPLISPQSIQHAYYIKMISDRLGIRIAEVPHIVEIGGGYGNFARIARRMGHRGRYQIVDLPQIHALQKHYLDEALPGHGVEFISMADMEPADFLMATFSVSEMPMETRHWLEDRYGDYRSLFFGATHLFEGTDNVTYFHGLAERLNGKIFKDKHRNAWFVTCQH